MKGYRLLSTLELEEKCPRRELHEAVFDLDPCLQTCLEYCDGIWEWIFHVWCPVREAEGFP